MQAFCRSTLKMGAAAKPTGAEPPVPSRLSSGLVVPPPHPCPQTAVDVMKGGSPEMREKPGTQSFTLISILTFSDVKLAETQGSRLKTC